MKINSRRLIVLAVASLISVSPYAQTTNGKYETPASLDIVGRKNQENFLCKCLLTSDEDWVDRNAIQCVYIKNDLLGIDPDKKLRAWSQRYCRNKPY